ncbi:MAG TPA: dienelactone hydrolase family protein [Thermoanaerobaculia bacterium]|nr:dienelactone hydrolase family protein [Thermoanaerobaculia bacterium]
MDEKLAYAAHVPEGDGPFPMVLLLHGWGANAHDLLGFAPHLHSGRALVLCPQGPVAIPIGRGMNGYGWFPLVPGQPADPEAFRRGADALRSFVDAALERYPIDRDRIVAMGFSQGGTMAFDLALRDPARYAGVAGLSSWLPGLLADSLPKLPEHEGLPVLVIHGTRDDRIAVERARESRELLRPYGVAMTYREIEGMGHEIREEALRIILKWLDEKAFGREKR